jgi:hypothetical protein
MRFRPTGKSDRTAAVRPADRERAVVDSSSGYPGYPDPGPPGGAQPYGDNWDTDSAGTSLAAATAAIIVARWNAEPSTLVGIAPSGNGHAVPAGNVHGGNVHGGNVQAEPTSGSGYYGAAYQAEEHVGTGFGESQPPPNGHGDTRTYGNGFSEPTPYGGATPYGPGAPGGAPISGPYAPPPDPSLAATAFAATDTATSSYAGPPPDSPYAAPRDPVAAIAGYDPYGAGDPVAGTGYDPGAGNPYGLPEPMGEPLASSFAPPESPSFGPTRTPSFAPPVSPASAPSFAADAFQVSAPPSGGGDRIGGSGAVPGTPSSFAAGFAGAGFAGTGAGGTGFAGPEDVDRITSPYPYPPSGLAAPPTGGPRHEPLSTVDAAALLDTGVPAPRVPADAATGEESSVLANLPFPKPFEPEQFEPFIRRRGEDGLPQRVPSEPDVPSVILPLNDPLRDPETAPTAEPRELSRIATFLRVDDQRGAGAPRPDGFDLNAVLTAVRSVADVSDAQLRWNAGAGHTLRIEFKDGVDEGRVTREVARLLRETMGLAAAPSEYRSTLDDPLERTGGGRVRATARPVARVGEPVPRVDRPLPPARRADGSPADIARVVVEHVQVTTLGNDAGVEVRLGIYRLGNREGGVIGSARGPAVDTYLLRLAAGAAADAIDRLLTGPHGSVARCAVEQVALVPFPGCEVAVVLLLLVQGTVPHQLSGSAVVAGDPVQAVVRATLSAVNRRLESLLP